MFVVVFCGLTLVSCFSVQFLVLSEVFCAALFWSEGSDTQRDREKLALIGLLEVGTAKKADDQK